MIQVGIHVHQPLVRWLPMKSQSQMAKHHRKASFQTSVPVRRPSIHGMSVHSMRTGASVEILKESSDHCTSQDHVQGLRQNESTACFRNNIRIYIYNIQSSKEVYKELPCFGNYLKASSL